jgi:RNA polymerase sigma-70 factor (sigma-E family)
VTAAALDGRRAVSTGAVAEEGFAEFADAAWPGLLRYAHLLTGERASAEDLVQTALLRTGLRWGHVRADDPTAYVKRAIARQHLNRVTRLLRRERVVDVVPDRAVDDETTAVVEHTAMWRALATLPPRQRAVLVLRYYEQLSEREIADVLGIAPGTVKSTASKGLAALRHRLEES